MSTPCEVMTKLNEKSNDMRTEFRSAYRNLEKQSMTAQMMDLISKSSDVSDPHLKAKLVEELANMSLRIANNDLKVENDKIFSNAYIDKDVYDFNKNFASFIIKEWQHGWVYPGSFWGAVLSFLNKTFKSWAVSIALGRVINESIQSSMLVVVQRLKDLATNPINRMAILNKVGLDTKHNIPDPGYISRVDYSERQFWEKNLLSSSNPMLEMLSKPLDFVNKWQDKAFDKTVRHIENHMYRGLFYEKLNAKIEELKAQGKAWEYLIKDQITSENSVSKTNIINQLKRQARSEAKRLFFDYTQNPLIVHKMEQYIPFSNFMYSGMEMISKYPKTFIFAATALNNLQYGYGDTVWYTDEEGQKIDAGVQLYMPMLAAIGLGWVQLNLQRMLQISPISTSLNPSPIFSFLTNREDFRWQKFYKTGDFSELQNIAIGFVSPPIQRLWNGLSWEGNVADITETMAYLSTWVMIKDKTQKMAWGWYINGEFDKLLELSDMQLNEFFKHPSNEKTWLTKQAIIAAQKAKEIWLLDMDYEKDPKKVVLQAMSWMGVLGHTIDQKTQSNDSKAIANLQELVLGKVFEYDYKDFNSYLDKVEKFSRSKYFKDMKDYNPTIYKNYKHFADNMEFYRTQSKAMDMLNKEETKSQWEAMLMAIKYHFEWDEGMSVEEKANALRTGKLTKPMMWEGWDGVPAGPKMTEWYFNSLSNKWGLAMNYLNQANKVTALTSIRKFYTHMAYTVPSQERSKYWNIVNKVYNEEQKAFSKFAVHSTPEFELYLLSKDYKWFQDYQKKQEEYLDKRSSQRFQSSSSVLNTYANLDDKEKKAYQELFGTDTKAMTKRMIKEAEAINFSETLRWGISNKEQFDSILKQLNVWL